MEGVRGMDLKVKVGSAPCCSQEVFQEEAIQEEQSIPERPAKPKKGKESLWKRLFGRKN